MFVTKRDNRISNIYKKNNNLLDIYNNKKIDEKIESINKEVNEPIKEEVNEPIKEIKIYKQKNKHKKYKQPEIKEPETKEPETKESETKEPEINEYGDIIYNLIPLNIFQTWDTLNLPLKMKENMELLKKENPEFTHYLYDDKMCRDFLKNNYESDILYTFDKLKPGAYKADLWRYCILYKKGGIYLDIKYKCYKNFKFITLTNKEYWVKDRPMIVNGIYQALMITYPYNKLVYKAIYDIVKNVKYNIYTKISPLCVTGPGLLGSYFKPNEFDNMELKNIGDIITLNDKKILVYYKEYRKEQYNTRGRDKYYDTMWWKLNIYNFKMLKSIKTVEFTKNTIRKINGENITLYTCNPNIYLHKGNIYIHQRWVNYYYNEMGNRIITPKKWISLNSRFIIDEELDIISNEIFMDDDYEIFKTYSHIGIEDIRLFNYNNVTYYIGTTLDRKRNNTSITSNIYDIDNNVFELNKKIINPTFYDLNLYKIPEKNWVFVEYKDKPCIVYKWYPLQIGSIDYDKGNLDLIHVNYIMDDFFKDAKGSSCGLKYKNRIWFLLHKSQVNNRHNRPEIFNLCYHYQHFFAIFDLNMKLISYTETFKFHEDLIEFCTGFVIKDNKMFISYGASDCKSYVSIYSIDTIQNKLKWYNPNYN